MISLAVSPVREGPDGPRAGERIGPRIPALGGREPASDSGIWLAAPDRDTAAAAPGVSREGEHKVVMDGKEYATPRVAKNCATCLDTFKWKLGAGGSALHFSAANATEAGFRHGCCRFAVLRPRAPWFSADFPAPACPGSWSVSEAAQRHWRSLQLSVDAARLVTALATFANLSGSPRRGRGYLCQYAARLNASRRLPVDIGTVVALRQYAASSERSRFDIGGARPYALDSGRCDRSVVLVLAQGCGY